MSSSVDRISRVESSFYFRTLSGFVSSYIGESAILDLVNESSVAGRIEEIDG